MNYQVWCQGTWMKAILAPQWLKTKLKRQIKSLQTPPGPAFPSYSQQHQSAAMAVSESNVTSDRRYLCLNATEFRSDSRASSQQTDDLSDVPSASASGGSSPDVATAEMIVSPLAAGFAETDDLFIMRPSFSGLPRILLLTMSCYCSHLGSHTTVPVIHLSPSFYFRGWYKKLSPAELIYYLLYNIMKTWSLYLLIIYRIIFVGFLFLMVGDFDAVFWKSHGTCFTIAGMWSGCRWFEWELVVMHRSRTSSYL